MNGRRFRSFPVLDFNREALSVEAAYRLPAGRVTQLLERTMEEQSKPQGIRVDNGPAFISQEFKDSCKNKDIRIQYIQAGKPMQNGYIERFNRTFRENILDAYLLEDINQVQRLTDEWMQDNNYNRPQEALDGLTLGYFKKAKCGDMEKAAAFPTSLYLKQQ